MNDIERSNFAGSVLTADQSRLAQALAASLDPRQACWVGGYFAGLGDGLARAARQPATSATPPAGRAPTAPSAATDATRRTLTILYGSETGNSAGVATRLAAAARERGLAPALVDIGEYKTRKLKDERDLLIVTATHGEGDPPQPARSFFEFIEGRKAPKLPALRYAVLALGDMSYEQFCGAGKRLDERLEALGAQRLHPRVDCDVDYEDAAAAWTGDVLALLASDHAGVAKNPTSDEPARSLPALVDAATRPLPSHDKRNPFSATVIENIVLTGRGSTKETRHVELSLTGSGMHYEPGDALGIVSDNDPAVVTTLLDALHLGAEAAVTVKDRSMTLGDALASVFEITTATQRFLEHWTGLTGRKDLFSLMTSADRATFLRGNHIVDIVRSFPLDDVDPQQFISGLRPLKPRLYSIASSLAAAPDEAHLTISPVRYMLHGERRSGVASGQLADRVEIESTLPVYIQSNPRFRLPADGRPIIMIGAGTGIAPYRAFLQQREACGDEGRSWLILGERNFRTDFLYQAEWQGYLKDEVLTRMDVAFSRDHAEKVYVQNRIRERGREIYEWLEDGANIYVCGDAARLAPDVHQALLDVVEPQAGIHREAAGQYLRDLERDHRYQRDVY